ncbi:MAG: FAD-dependent oxidoreductase [Thermodesulfobacteriota bacterium]
MQDHAQVVIIGGGIAGASIAYHLTQMGCRDVAVIEKGELTSGSTWHAAGLVGQLRSSRNVTRMLQYSVSLYEQLEAETGLTTGWKRCGCLHLAGTPDRLLELKKGATTARSFGLDMHLISPKEALDLFPVMSLDGIIGAAFMPSDGQADPSGLTMALAKGATSRGARIYQHTRVTGFQLAGNRITAVVTDNGTIRCETVVNAAGMWAREIGRMMGVNVPLVPFQHQYLVTETIEGLPPGLPTIRDKDSLLYYKEEVGGLVMGGYEPNGIPWALAGIPKGFTQQLLEPDFDHFEPLAAAAMKRTPCLETVGISRLVNGPEAFTPDGNCILGPAPELENCFVAAGFNAFGIAAGGGAGRMLAEWIVAGEPSLDIWPLDIRRFGPYHRSPAFNLDRTREIYGKHYTISWPNEEHHSARGVRRSPLYHQLKEKGAVFGSKFGWERANWFAPSGTAPEDEHTFGLPNWFAHVGVEHRAAREKVVLIDQTSFSKFMVAGPQALSFLNRLAVNDIDRPVGSIVYTQMCNDRGGIECDLTITRIAENRFFIVTGTAFGLHDFSWIQRHLTPDTAATLSDVTSAYAVINVCGPLSRRLLEKVTADPVDNAAFPFAQCRQLTLGYAPVLAMRVTYVGELGYELYIPTEYAPHVYEQLCEAGRELGAVNAGYRAIESLRLEKGYRYWGAELSPDYTPYQAGLGFCVALDKEDFIGREALYKIKTGGFNSILCCFTLEDSNPRLLSGSETISHNGKVIGVVTSGGYGHFVEKTIAYGYLAVEHAGYADGYAIEVFAETLAATRQPRVLYDPERKRIMM